MVTRVDIILLSGGISFIVSVGANTVSYFIKKRIQEREERAQRKKEWHRELISICREIRRKAIDLDYEIPLDPLEKTTSSEDDSNIHDQINSISILISELDSEVANAPQNQRYSSVRKEAQNLLDYYRNPAGEGEEFTTTDFKQKLILYSEDVMDEIHHTSDYIDNSPY